MTAIYTDTSDKHLHEINRYADSAFPVGIYTVTREGILPDGRGYQDLHWHEELQLTRVEYGSLDIRVDGIDYTLHQGEAILINRNLLHVTTNLSENGKYISLNFPDQLLGFFPGSRMEQDYVFPYTRTYLFSAVILRPDTAWQKQILDILAEILSLISKDTDAAASEYQIASRLTVLWSVMVQNIVPDNAVPSKTYLRRQERIHTMLSFIYENYARHFELIDVVKQSDADLSSYDMIGFASGIHFMTKLLPYGASTEESRNIEELKVIDQKWLLQTTYKKRK